MRCVEETVGTKLLLKYPHFELILGDFAPVLLEVSFGMIFHNSPGTNHLKKCSGKHFYAGTLLNTNETLSFFITLLSYFVIFPSLFY